MTDEDELRLREIAKLRNWNEDMFVEEIGKAKSELGMSDQTALAHVMRLFEQSAHKQPKEPARKQTLPDFMLQARSDRQEVQPLRSSRPGEGGGPEAGVGRTEETLPVTPPAATCFDKLMDLTDGHLCEIYGIYGTGKSRLVHSIAIEAQSAGKRVLYLDTEGGLKREHIKQLRHYEYIGDELEDLIERVRWAKENRDKFDLLIADSVGHPIYVNYVAMRGMDEKLRSYQELAAIFRDMVRFARGEKGVDFGKRSALAIAVNHTVSEFARISDFVLAHKPVPREALESPLDPFGGQIHRVPKLILRSEPAGDGFKLITFKARDLPKNFEVARFSVGEKGVSINWQI